MKVRMLLVIGMLAAMLLAGCDNIFAPPREVPPPPVPESGADSPELTAPSLSPSRVYLVSKVDCTADRSAIRFTLYNPAEETLSLQPAASPKDRTLSVIMNGYPLRNLATYCGQPTLEAGESVDCVRSAQNDRDMAGFSKLGLENAGSRYENTVEARAPLYATEVAFSCGGNRPTYALTELSCAPGMLQFGVRNIFVTPLHLGKPVANGTSQNEYLHVSLNEIVFDDLDEDCGTDVLAPGETTNCILDADVRSGADANDVPETNTVTVRHQLYSAMAKFPCP